MSYNRRHLYKYRIAPGSIGSRVLPRSPIRDNDGGGGGFIRASSSSATHAAVPPTMRRIPPTTNNADRNSSSNNINNTPASKKSSRKRQKVSNPNNAPYITNNNDVPQIKGVSPSITPLLLSTVKAYKKYYTKQSKFKLEQHDNEDVCGNDNNGAREDKDEILNRIKEQNDAIRNEKHQKIMELENAAHDSMKQFMKALKQEVMVKSSSSKKDYKDESLSSSVAVSCLFFCLNLIQDSSSANNIQLCRAALKTTFELLKRGSDCRHTFFASSDSCEHIKSFVDAVASKRDGNNDEENNGAVRMFQTEALEMLHSLDDTYNNGGEIFPRLHVAMRYLEERKGILIHTHGQSRTCGVGGSGMARLRYDRDAAIEYGKKQQKIVLKIIKRMNVCFDVLVPRFDLFMDTTGAVGDIMPHSSLTKEGADGVSAESERKELGIENNNSDNDGSDDDEDDDDDDDGIDWEDGIDDDEDNDFRITKEENNVGTTSTQGSCNATEEITDNANGNVSNNNEENASKQSISITNNDTEEQHKNAVEQTLALMKSTGGIVGGEMEINFDKNQEEEEDFTSYQTIYAPTISDQPNQQTLPTNTTIAISTAKSTLQKYVNILSFRHMPRLSIWVDALITADGMTTAQPKQDDKYGKDSTSTPSPPEPIPTSLVLLTPTMRKKRKDTLQMLMKLKSDVASVLSSAGRLGIVPGGEEQENSCVSNVDHNSSVSAPSAGSRSTAPRSLDSHVNTKVTSAIRQSNATTGSAQICENDSKAISSRLQSQAKSWKEVLGLPGNGKNEGVNKDGKISLKHRLALQGGGMCTKRKRRKTSRLQIKYRST